MVGSEVSSQDLDEAFLLEATDFIVFDEIGKLIGIQLEPFIEGSLDSLVFFSRVHDYSLINSIKTSA